MPPLKAPTLSTSSLSLSFQCKRLKFLWFNHKAIDYKIISSSFTSHSVPFCSICIYYSLFSNNGPSLSLSLVNFMPSLFHSNINKFKTFVIKRDIRVKEEYINQPILYPNESRYCPLWAPQGFKTPTTRRFPYPYKGFFVLLPDQCEISQSTPFEAQRPHWHSFLSPIDMGPP